MTDFSPESSGEVRNDMTGDGRDGIRSHPVQDTGSDSGM